MIKTDIGWRAQVDILQRLVDHLVPAYVIFDPMYVPNFLRTFRAFATPQQVLGLLFGR